MPILDLPYLTRTITGIYGYRRRVPNRIRDKIGKTEIIQSFGTADPKVARRRYAVVHATVERTFTEAETDAGVSSDLVFEAALQSLRARGLPTNHPQEHWTADDRSAATDIVLANAGLHSMDELEEAFEAALPAERGRLRRISTELAIVQGTMSQPTPTISHCLQMKLNDRARNRDTQREDWIRYERERRRIVGEVIRKLGDKDIRKVSRADARLFLNELEQSSYRPGSVKKQIDFMKAMFDHGFQEYEYAGRNPWQKLSPVIPEDDEENGVSFEYAEVRHSLTMVGTINGQLRDIYRILACTGARLGEICGIEVGDVDLDSRAISLRFNSIRRLKNKKSVRIVPVVDAIAFEALRKRLGELASSERHFPVFPRYGRPNGSGSASAALGKWLTKIKLRDPDAERPKTTHSLRHTFKDALRELGVSRDIANKIQGHTAGDAADDYGSSDLLSAKRQAATQAWMLIMGDKPR